MTEGLGLLLRSWIARDPACLVCGAERIRRSGRPYGRLGRWLGIVAVRCGECGRRFPISRRVALSRLTLGSGIPDSHPQKGAIERTVRDVFRGIPGHWTIDILANTPDGRWLVTARRPGRALRVSLAPEAQEPAAIREAFETSLQKEGLTA